jgi:hypothetical protein
MNGKSAAIRWLGVVLLGALLGIALSFAGALLFRPHPRPQAIFPDEGDRKPSTAARLSGESVRRDLIDVIQSQLAAFRKNDYPKAYHYAASGLRDEVSLPAFERMVRHSYPEIAGSSGAQFGMIVDNGDEAVVEVVIITDTGRPGEYEYLLTRELTGWRINGVIRTRPPGQVI